MSCACSLLLYLLSSSQFKADTLKFNFPDIDLNFLDILQQMDEEELTTSQSRFVEENRNPYPDITLSLNYGSDYEIMKEVIDKEIHDLTIKYGLRIRDEYEEMVQLSDLKKISRKFVKRILVTNLFHGFEGFRISLRNKYNNMLDLTEEGDTNATSGISYNDRISAQNPYITFLPELNIKITKIDFDWQVQLNKLVEFNSESIRSLLDDIKYKPGIEFIFFKFRGNDMLVLEVGHSYGIYGEQLGKIDSYVMLSLNVVL